MPAAKAGTKAVSLCRESNIGAAPDLGTKWIAWIRSGFAARAGSTWTHKQAPDPAGAALRSLSRSLLAGRWEAGGSGSRAGI